MDKVVPCISEFEPEDVKSVGRKKFISHIQSEHEQKTESYRKALTNLFRQKDAKVRSVARQYKINNELLNELYENISSRAGSQKERIYIAQKIEIPAIKPRTHFKKWVDGKMELKDKLEELAKEFHKNFGFELADFLKDNKISKKDRPLRVSSNWVYLENN